VLPASLLFYTHQHIAYGGTFGQYYLEGLVPYLSTLGEYWATTVILLVSYASIWRAAAEIAVWTAAALAGRTPAFAVRRAVEVACAVAYYGGVPALLALRYLA
jgi:apolipoprotein N-acyltransferase